MPKKQKNKINFRNGEAEANQQAKNCLLYVNYRDNCKSKKKNAVYQLQLMTTASDFKSNSIKLKLRNAKEEKK